MYKVVKKSDAVIRKISENKVATNYITKDISPHVSFTTLEATDYEEKETTSYNRIYHVLKGTLTLTFDDQVVILLEGDSCYIEKGTNYEMCGTFKAVVVNQPAFGT